MKTRTSANWVVVLLVLTGCNRDAANKQARSADQSPVGTLSPATRQPPPTVATNAILISVDTLRPDVLTPYDNKIKTSPNLAQFAKDAALFTDAISQGASTAISHKSLLYSLYPWITGMTEKNMVPHEKGPSPLETLQGAGIFTGAILGGAQLSAVYGFNKGFDTFLETSRDTRRGIRNARKTLAEVQAAAAEREPIRRARLAAKRDGKPAPNFPRQSRDRTRGGMTPAEFEPLSLEILEEDSMAWLDEHHQKPFFLFLHTYKVHCPYSPPQEYVNQFVAPYNGPVDPSDCRGLYQRVLDEADLIYLRQMYMSEVAYVDEFLGRFFAKLKELGIYGNTIIALVSDHGESFGEHGRLGHNRLDWSMIRVPLIIKVPGFQGTRIDAPVELVDVMPTVFAALGVSAPYRFQGLNLLPVIKGEQQADPNRLRFSNQVERTAVLKGDWKLVFTDAENKALYNWRTDPRELKNVLKSNPDIAAELRKDFDRMLTDNKGVAKNFVQQALPKPEISDALREQLEALGYIDG